VDPGAGNLNSDPLFGMPVEASTAPTTTGNLRLRSGSPAIDAGDSAVISPTLPANDLDGQPRLIGSAVDMGAYEHAYLPLTVSRTGSGAGVVTSLPAGLSCGLVCTSGFQAGAMVILTAAPLSGSTFAGWSGDADCADGAVTMDAAKTCTATFLVSSHKVYLPFIRR
jgi:hypothetical protein